MPGLATFTPYSPPLDGAASVFVVSRYDRASGEAAVLPNIKCLSIHYVEGPTPPTAQFEYVLDDSDPSSPFPTQLEDLWPLTATGPYVVQPDDELIVVEVRERQRPYLVFHGFAQVAQVVAQGNGQRITFGASGAAVRLWDTVVEGATYRPTSAPQDGDPLEVDLPTWFNPEGRPNCTPDDHDVDAGADKARPVFLQDDDAVDPDHPDKGSDGQTRWTLGKFVRYLAWTCNADETYVKNPVAPTGTLDDYLRAIAPKKDVPYFDVADPATYDANPIEIRSYDATGKPWIEAVADQLRKYGFEIFFELTPDDDGLPDNRIVIYRKDGLDGVSPKALYLPPAGSSLADGLPGFAGFALARDGHSPANEFVVESKPTRFELTAVLAPGFTPDPADCASPTAIAAFDRSKAADGDDDVRKKYRYYLFDEAGLGHWDSGTSAWVDAGEPTSLDDVLGAPANGVDKYVARRRPGAGKLISLDDVGKPRRAKLEISRDYAGDAPAVWDPSDTTSTWRTLGEAGWTLDKESLAIWINADNPETWRLPRADGVQAPGDMVRAITSQASPGSDPATKRFYLRLTTVIEGDEAIGAIADKRPAAPSKFAIRRRVDARDHFKQTVVSASSVYNTKGDEVIVRDDSKAALAHAEALRTAHEFPPVVGSITIPWIGHSYGIGDAIGSIAGRGIDLRLNAGSPAGESPKYPIVVGLSWSCQNPQSTTLQLSDRRAEPDRGHDDGHNRR